MTTRKNLSQREKVLLVAYQDGWCSICHGKLKPGNIDYDHIQQLAMGGDNAADNWRAICHDPCHLQKSKRDSADRGKVRGLAYGKSKKGKPLPGTKASGWRKRMDGTVERR